MQDIFLSYNRDDQEAADMFVRAFEAAGLSVWWDVDLRAGQVYDEVTEKALRDAKAVVVLWSRKSVASRWVRAEATLAQRAGTFVPCMIEPCERPIMFELTQTPDLTHWLGDLADPAWQAFAGHVRDFLGRKGGSTGSAPSPAPAPAVTPAPRAARPSSERRQITFLSARLSNGRELASSMDPEDWHDILSGIQPPLNAIIEKFGATAKWDAHTLSALFGYPAAQEDAAQRAIRAALSLVERTATLADDVVPGTGAAMELQVGIHTSDVLVTADSSGDTEMFGDGSAIAKTARDLAGPASVLVTDPVHELAARAFDLEKVEGGGSETSFYKVAGARSSGGTTRGWASSLATGFFGREDELALIRSRWSRVQSGEGQFVLVCGEPGIGKTRLIDEFSASLRTDDHYWITLQGASLFPNTPYHAIGHMLRHMAEERGGDPAIALADGVRELGLPARLIGLVAPVIGIDLPGDMATPNLTQEQQRSQLLATLVEATFDLARSKPLVLLVDDCQWIDPSSMEVIQMLVEQAESDRILIIGTARPEFQAPWSERENHSRINLGRLPQNEIRAIIAEAAGDSGIDTKTIQTVLDRADGVPLFAEELARLIAASHGEGGIGRAAAIPPTLRSLLAARLDRLGPARELLQIAAILGRDFPHSLLAEITDHTEDEMGGLLALLADEQLLFMRGAPPNSTYRFKHALVQDAAYDTLPKRRQRELHGLAAITIVERFPHIAESQQELLATHWTRAGKGAEAVAAWQKAGETAYDRGACKEAAAHFRQGLSVLETQPEGPSRDELETSLWSALNRALQQTHGYADPETVEAASRALALAKQGGMLGKVLIEEAQLWRAVITAGDYQQADTITERVLSLSKETPEAEEIPWLDYFHANARIQTGFYTGRMKDFEADYANLQHVISAQGFSHSPLDDVVAIGVAALAGWVSGRSDLAIQRINHAISVAENGGQPYAIAVANHFAGTVTAFEGDYEAALVHTRKALNVCEENGFAYIAHLTRAKFGWIHAKEETGEDDIATMRKTMDEMAKANSLVGLTINMNRMAMAMEVHGRIEEAMETAEEALIANPQERVVRPQTLEILARLKRKLGRDDEAEEDYRAAIALAAEMGLIALELPPAIQLSQMLADSGRKTEAAKVLEASLARCTPQTNTPDLATAQQALAQLSGAMTA